MLVISVPSGDVCQRQRIKCSGLPFHDSVTSPQVFPDESGVGGGAGGGVKIAETEVAEVLQQPVELL
jgi:hypothetical protein